MRFLRVSIDGYGRFSNVSLEFTPGLQVIIGPNEMGKSTLRAFIADMLYGQKRSGVQRSYDESNQLRIPWDSPDCYGGALVYQLSNGHEIEVTRNFDRKRESVQVFDRTDGREITGEFELLRNREVNFAAQHLGLSKEVFLGTATINHFSLDELGDTDALHQIREKLLSLADSGDESNSAEAALRLLKRRVAAIGPPAARTKPLPAARAALLELNQEYAAVEEVLRELAGVAENRRGLLGQIARQRESRLALEQELRLSEAHERADQLRQAEELTERIDAATKQCFALGAVRDFPLDRLPEALREETQVNTARMQLERTRGERAGIVEQLQAEQSQVAPESARPPLDLPEDLETRYGDLLSNAQVLDQRLTEAQSTVEAAEVRVEHAQRTLGELPDFSRLSPEPVEWITQLASSFGVALRTRVEEQAERERLKTAVDERRAAIAENHTLFKDVENFPEQAREYELQRRALEEKLSQQAAALHGLKTARDEISDKAGFLWIAAGCGLALAGIVIAFVYYQKLALLLPGAVMLGTIGFCAGNIAYARTRLARLNRDICDAQFELDALENSEPQEESLVERLLRESGCETVRELEARHDQYREASLELGSRIKAYKAQCAKAREAEERIPPFLERLRETFQQAGVAIEDENDVQNAAGRAIAKYQDYREAKRRLAEGRAQLDRAQTEQRRLKEERQKVQRAADETERELRRFMRENGFTDERQHESGLSAIRAYRARVAKQRERRGRVDLLRERVQELDRQLEREEADLAAHEGLLARLLHAMGVADVAEMHTAAERAREYQEHWRRRGELNEQLKALLQGQDLTALRAEAAEAGELGPPPARAREEIKRELDAVNAAVECVRDEERALQLTLTERSASLRSLNEIEEERAAIAAQVGELELELEATSYAMALIEDIARDKHAIIAPKLAARASACLSDITAGAYSELFISRDLNISVRIPQTRRMHDAPEKSLSKGTVDQIYLALRLALVQEISASGEPVPMLLDDPFANYDDTRLEGAIHLLNRIAEQNQVILFTCREDVARAAEQADTPILRL